MERVADQSSQQSYAFDNWVLQADGLLLRDGKGVHLAPKELHVFRLLLGAAGSLLSKDWLLDQVWPRCNVAEESLTRCIYSLRKTLGAQKSYIKTVYGKGYSFAGQVSEHSPIVQRRSSLLVLPIAMADAGYAQDLHEQLINCLVGAFGETLSVMPAGLTSLDATVDSLTWIERLSPDYYLSVRCGMRDEEPYMWVELVRAGDHALLQAERVPIADGQAQTDKVISLVAQRLPGLRSPSASCAAYPLTQAYMNGILGLQTYTVESLQDALVQFLGCLRVDASYAPLWCGLADTYLALGALGVCDRETAITQARNAVARALTLEPGSHAATLRLALLSSLCGQFDTAEALFRPVMMVGACGDCDYLYAWHLWCRGDSQRALESLERCLANDPSCVSAWVLSVRIALKDSVDAARLVLKRAQRTLRAEHPVLAALHALVLHQSGQADAARAVINSAGLSAACAGEPGLVVRHVDARARDVRPAMPYEGWSYLAPVAIDAGPEPLGTHNIKVARVARLAWPVVKARTVPWHTANSVELRTYGYLRQCKQGLQR
ncbi:Transcriptional regulator HilA [Pseudomonas fluorescens]|uniref:winged helix-turn-helix domain-containing protein n=1 Tax=Pseudomonas fluorescens TaxID=294 RepID=UPI0012429690|nr:winged helix-turn-helix domain-containing protein [Pseudomonas fluorescens]VVP32627.1 Transcriptional regulator HilA [Pseudomonas fluorescens]